MGLCAGFAAALTAVGAAFLGSDEPVTVLRAERHASAEAAAPPPAGRGLQTLQGLAVEKRVPGGAEHREELAIVLPAVETDAVTTLTAAALSKPVVRELVLDGLRLDPCATPEDLAHHYAEHDGDALARARFRLGAVLEAFHNSGSTSPIVWLLPSDVETIQRELVVVDERIAAARTETDRRGSVHAELADGEGAYVARHAGATSEELFVRALRFERERAAEELRLLERFWAAGDYEVGPAATLMT